MSVVYDTVISGADAPHTMPASARVSLVIPCRNEAEFIAQLLDGVLAQDHPIHEVIVVDNGSTDESIAVVDRYARAHPELPLQTVRAHDEGAAAAMNEGIRAATGEIIVRLDGHSTPRPDYVRRCVERLADPGAGVVGGTWEIEPGAPTRKARAIALAVGSRLGSGGAAYRHGDAHQAVEDVDTVPFGAFRRSLWDELGGYDYTLQVVEDAEFNYRVRKAGYRVILDPTIRCTYFPRRRLRTLGRQYLRYGWWKIPMLMKHPGAVRLRQLIPLGFVTSVLILAFWSAFAAIAKMALLFLLAVYAVAILGSALIVSRRARDIRLWLPIAGAFAIIHFAWGLGALTHVVTLGRWPPWRLSPSVQRA